MHFNNNRIELKYQHMVWINGSQGKTTKYHDDMDDIQWYYSRYVVMYVPLPIVYDAI